MSDLLIKNAEVGGVPGVDVLMSGGHIEAVGRGLRAEGAGVIEADGGALIPGLTDHHVHLHATAAAAASVHCGPPRVTDAAAMARALDEAPGDENGWVRGVGYIETVAGELDSSTLDRLHPRRPVRVQHRSGAMWVLNGAAVTATELASARHPGVERDAEGRPTGRVWRADDWLRERLPVPRPPSLTALGAELARFGVTAVTDATPDLRSEAQHAIATAVRSGELPQRVHLLGVPVDGSVDSASGRVTVGPFKIVLADSGLPDPTELADLVRRIHGTGRAVAAHCVSREALLILMSVLGDVGTIPGDRIEHAALVPHETIPELHRCGIRVVTQPGFLAHRGDDYLRDVQPIDLPDLYRCRTLVDAAVPLALSSDAPYGPLDPWQVMSAAVDRSTESGRVVGRGERLTPAEALAGYLAPSEDPGGPPRRLVRGKPADAVLLHAPLSDALAALDCSIVRLTVISGVPVSPGS